MTEKNKFPSVLVGAIGSAVAVLLVVATLVWAVGSYNPETPAGYVGYLTKGAILGKTRFVGTQVGPTSPGREWLLSAVNVSITPYTYTETFDKDSAVLAKDNLRLSFQVHILFKIKEDKVKDFVEKFSTIHESKDPNEVVLTAYDNLIKEPLRTYARDEIQKYDGLSIKLEIEPIGQAMFNRVQELTKDTPFDVISVVVGNIQYPEAVSDAVSLKLAATQDLEKKATQIEMTKKDAEMRVIEARGIADAMGVINNRLTPMYLQHEAIEAQKLTVNSPNHTTIYLPIGPNGVPVVGALNLSPQHQADAAPPAPSK